MPTMVLETCRACIHSCRQGDTPFETFRRQVEEIARAFESPGTGVPAPEAPKRHHRLTISISACPNSCSRPQIADIGLVFAETPCMPEHMEGKLPPTGGTTEETGARSTSGGCSGCDACVEVCPERAISRGHQPPVLDRAVCLSCGQCRRACPAGCITVEKAGVQFLIGGRLGRHPRLAERAGEFLGEDEALGILRRCLEAFAQLYRPGLRLAALLDRRDPGLMAALSPHS